MASFRFSGQYNNFKLFEYFQISKFHIQIYVPIGTVLKRKMNPLPRPLKWNVIMA